MVGVDSPFSIFTGLKASKGGEMKGSAIIFFTKEGLGNRLSMIYVTDQGASA